MAKDRPVFAFVRKGNSLFPEMEYDLSALDGIAQGQRVKVEIKQWRNLDRLRAYWATLRDCVNATGCAPTTEALDAYIRPAVGFIDMLHVRGQWVPVPRHINTSQCDEPEMIAFFERVNERLASEFGYVKEYENAPLVNSPPNADDAGDAVAAPPDSIATNTAAEDRDGGLLVVSSGEPSPLLDIAKRIAKYARFCVDEGLVSDADECLSAFKVMWQGMADQLSALDTEDREKAEKVKNSFKAMLASEDGTSLAKSIDYAARIVGCEKEELEG